LQWITAIRSKNPDSLLCACCMTSPCLRLQKPGFFLFKLASNTCLAWLHKVSGGKNEWHWNIQIPYLCNLKFQKSLKQEPPHNLFCSFTRDMLGIDIDIPWSQLIDILTPTCQTWNMKFSLTIPI
jgi:hypothetical protein